MCLGIVEDVKQEEEAVFADITAPGAFPEIHKTNTCAFSEATKTIFQVVGTLRSDRNLRDIGFKPKEVTLFCNEG